MNFPIDLEKIGLTRREALVYWQLLRSGPLTPTEIAVKTELKRPNIYDVLKSLEIKGLIHYQLTNKSRLIAASSPKNLVDVSRQQFDLAKSILPQLMNLDREQSFQSSISFYQGRKAMREVYGEFAHAKKKEAWHLASPRDLNNMLGEDFMKSIINKRLKRGVKVRSLRPIEKDSELTWTEQTETKHGRELTEVAYVPPEYTFSLSMVIYDDKTVFSSSKEEGFGFLVESHEFTEVMRMFYDKLWRHSGKLKKQ